MSSPQKDPEWVQRPRKASFEVITRRISEDRQAIQRKISEDRVATSRKISAGWDVLRKRSVSDTLRLLKGKYLCIITGAGNGLGRAIANLVFQEAGIYPYALSGSRLILIDKDMESLRETSGKKMKQFLKHRRIEVDLVCVNLSDLTETKNTMMELMSSQDRDFEQAILINNISTPGDVGKKLSDYTNYKEIEEFINLNIISKLYLTNEICAAFPKAKKTVVNTINFDNARPNPYFGLGFMATSAVRSFSEVLAKENPQMKVLLFEPSRVDSNTTKDILERSGNEVVKKEIIDSSKLQQLNAPMEAAKKLSKILGDDKFRVGRVIVWREEDATNNNI